MLKRVRDARTVLAKEHESRVSNARATHATSLWILSTRCRHWHTYIISRRNDELPALNFYQTGLRRVLNQLCRYQVTPTRKHVLICCTVVDMEIGVGAAIADPGCAGCVRVDGG